MANQIWAWCRVGVLSLTLIFCVSGYPLAAELSVRSITVTGSGSVEGRPDQVEVNAPVVTAGKITKATVDANSRTMTEVIANLRKAGFDDNSVATTRFNVSPRFQDRDNRAETPVISGYQVNGRIRVTVADISGARKLLDQITAAGINQISGLQYILTERDALADRALGAAMANARHKSEITADASGVTLGPVLKVEERGITIPQPRLMAFLKGNTVSIVPGGQTVRASVSATYALTGNKSK